jgi:acetyl-CoA acetyltransferase
MRDRFSRFVPMQLEFYRFCAPGEARQFISDGRIELGGALPVNPQRGLIGEAYSHQMIGLAEAARQIRGTAMKQVPAVENILVHRGSKHPNKCSRAAEDEVRTMNVRQMHRRS